MTFGSLLKLSQVALLTTTQRYYVSMNIRADGTPITIEQNQRWFDDDNVPVVEVLKRLLTKTSNSGQDSACIINSASELIEMKINFNDQHCFQAIILKIQDMVETLPEHIITNSARRKTLVKKILASFKKVNRLIYDRIVQSNPSTVYEFNKCLLKVRSDAVDCEKEHKH